ncbi:NAD(P)H-binding protein (plasmid) [Agrobacterium salinitolerans]|uniref:NAD(P)H-binding protein n=1 Tax=Agrobacterium salinitolerans TaxID=1183413 RepID=UPI001C21105D|nr:NAD(P)H-binding protein [Agrobacterium salinitolerans]QXC52497.1 NAD(P)H-binding protein [Agrobacterium salinitolerans]
MTATKGILIVGGYGHVGSRIAERLLIDGITPVRLAGRSLEKARAMATRLGCEARHIDLDRSETWDDAIKGTDIVLVCMDQQDTSFPAHVLAKGLTYVDITASDSFFRQVETLGERAIESGGRAVLSIGLAPGLTNLLVKACAEKLDHARSARIGIMLGLGDAHGPAAIDWTLNQLLSPRGDQVQMETIPFGISPHGYPAIPFDFADQHVVRRTLGLSDASTLLAFDPPMMARMMFALLGFIRAKPWLTRLMGKTMPYMRIGSDRAALAIEVRGEVEARTEIFRAVLEGRREADITALVAALTVEHLAQTEFRAGVWHIDQILSIDRLAPALGEYGVLLRLP